MMLICWFVLYFWLWCLLYFWLWCHQGAPVQSDLRDDEASISLKGDVFFESRSVWATLTRQGETAGMAKALKRRRITLTLKAGFRCTTLSGWTKSRPTCSNRHYMNLGVARSIALKVTGMHIFFFLAYSALDCHHVVALHFVMLSHAYRQHHFSKQIYETHHKILPWSRRNVAGHKAGHTAARSLVPVWVGIHLEVNRSAMKHYVSRIGLKSEAVRPEIPAKRLRCVLRSSSNANTEPRTIMSPALINVKH